MSIRYESGQERDCTVPGETPDRLNVAIKNITNIDDGPSFCSSPGDYEWRYIGKEDGGPV